MLNCAVDHILQEFFTLFLTRFSTYKIATPPQTKMPSKDDIKGFVSLKFLRLWSYISVMFVRRAGTKVNAGAREKCKGCRRDRAAK
jgi:hypothetical protein